MPYVTIVFGQLIPAVATMSGADPPTLVQAGCSTLEVGNGLVPVAGAGTMQSGLPPNPPVPPVGGLPVATAWLYTPTPLLAGDSSPHWVQAWVPVLGVAATVHVHYVGHLLLGGARRQVVNFRLGLTLQPGGAMNALQVTTCTCSSPSARLSAYPTWEPSVNEWIVAVNFNAPTTN